MRNVFYFISYVTEGIRIQFARKKQKDRVKIINKGTTKANKGEHYFNKKSTTKAENRAFISVKKK